VIHGTNELWISVPSTATVLSASLTGATHSVLGTALLFLLSLAAAMTAMSPAAGVLRLVRSLIHRYPVTLLF